MDIIFVTKKIGMMDGTREKIINNSKKVQNVRTGEIFNSLSEAAKSINISPSTLSTHIKNNETCKHEYFKYLT